MSIPIIKGLDSLLTLEIQRLDNTGNSEKNDFTKIINEASQSNTLAGGELEEPKIISPGTEWIEYSLLDEDLPDLIVGKDGAIDRITLFDRRATLEFRNWGTLVLTSGGIEALDRNSEDGREKVTTVDINSGIFSNNASGYIIFRTRTGEEKIVEFQNFDKTDLITFGSDTIKLANLSELQNIESPDAVYLEGGIAEITPSGPYQHYYNGDLIIDASKASDLMSSESGHLVITSGGISDSRLVTEEEMVFTVTEFEPDTTGYIEFPQRSVDGNPAIVTFDDIGTLREKWDTTFRLSISDLSQIEDKTIEELTDRIKSFGSVSIDPIIPVPEPEEPLNIIEAGTQYVRRLVSTPGESVTKEERLLLDINRLVDFNFSDIGAAKLILKGEDSDKVILRDNQVFLKSGIDLEDFSKLDFVVKAVITNDFLGMPILPTIELDSISVSISVLPPIIFRVLQSVVAASPDEYLEKYPDVAAAVKNGTMPSAVFHYANFGFFEGRDLPLILSETQYVRKLVETPNEKLTGQERLLLDFELRDGFVPVLEGEDAEKVIIRDNQVFLRDDVDTSRFDNIEFEIVPVSEVFFARRPVAGSDVSLDTVTEFLGPLERPAISVSIDVVSQEIYESMVKEVEALPQAYLDLHPDVAEAVENGTMPSALFHFINFGFYEGRSTGVFSTSDPDIIDFEIFS